MRNCFCYFKDGNKLKTSPRFLSIKNWDCSISCQTCLKATSSLVTLLKVFTELTQVILNILFLITDSRIGSWSGQWDETRGRATENLQEAGEAYKRCVATAWRRRKECATLQRPVRPPQQEGQNHQSQPGRSGMCPFLSTFLSLFYSPSILTSHVCSLPFIPLDLHRQSFIVYPRYVSR